MKIKRIHILLMILALATCAIPFRARLRRTFVATVQAVRGKKSVEDRIKQFGASVQNRLAPDFKRIGISYPPEKITIIGIKQDKILEVWVSDPPQFLKAYPILGASGVLGPKLHEGDRQVPEGLYQIESLNPNSLYHLALRVNYPSQFDKAKGHADGRKNLGGDIMIHGKNCSIGCIAIGDEAAEELFVLAAKTGIEKISVILTPVDFRERELPAEMPSIPDWTQELYDSIKQELLKYK